MLLEEKDKSAEKIDDETVLSLSLKNPAHFAELVNRYRPAFFRRAKRLLGADPAVEEVVADTFIKIYFNANRFQTQGQGSFRSWAYRILHNTALSAIRRQKHDTLRHWSEDWLDLLVDEQGERERERREIKDFVLAVLLRLPERLSRVLRLKFFDGYSLKEIAAGEKLSLAAVKTCLYRAKKEFKRLSALHEL